MDENTERKVRDLKLKILLVEKELSATQHTLALGGWLKAGHAGQMSRMAEKDRKRLDEKLEQLRARLHELESGEAAPAAVAEPPVVETAQKETAAKKPAAAKGRKAKKES